MDDFARKLVGPISKIELPKVGAALKQGERAWTLVVGGKAVDMLAPIDGEVVAVNDALLKNPGALNKDPYNAGWLVKVQSPKIKANLKNLLRGELAQKWTEQAVEGLVTKANLALGAVAADGGAPVDGVARQLDAEHWDNIAKEYFLTD
ncbi:MAG TPA: glycine cleavage system protein H, partial [bacterium]|nr:glycine cleavage system protein H [bacterium]